eukprot:453024_1
MARKRPRKRRLSSGWGLGTEQNKDHTPPVPEISQNDDEAEKVKTRVQRRGASISRSIQITPGRASRSVRRLSRSNTPHARASPYSPRGTPHDKLDNFELAELYSTCVRLSAAGKITQKNTWKLSLIDYMDELIQRPAGEEEDEEERQDGGDMFMRASDTIDASVKIYSCRVDSVHSEMFRVLGGLNSSDKSRSADGLGPDGSAKPASSRGPSSTLVKPERASTINAVGQDLCYEVDPMFHKMASAFDEGGARGMLLHQLGVQGGCQIVFDSDFNLKAEPKPVAEPDNSDIPPDAFSMLLGLLAPARAQLTQSQADPGSQARPDSGGALCPTLDGFKHAVREVEHSILSLNDSSIKMSDDEKEAALSSDDDGLSPGALDFDMLDPAELETAAHEEDLLLSGLRESGEVPAERPVGRRRGGGFLGGGFDASSRSSQRAADSLDDFSVFDSQIFSNWAGPEHWKFRKPRAQKEIEARKAKSSARGKAVLLPFLDMENFVPLDFAAPPTRSSNCLSAAARKKAETSINTLPNDLHYQPAMLQKLFHKPEMKVRFRKVPAEGGGSGDTMEIEWYNYHNPRDNEFCAAIPEASGAANYDDDDGGMFDDFFNSSDSEIAPHLTQIEDIPGDFDLVEAPKTVGKVHVKFSKVAKRVDVRNLKKRLWECLKLSASPSRKRKRDEDDQLENGQTEDDQKEDDQRDGKKECDQKEDDTEDGKKEDDMEEDGEAKLNSFQESITQLRTSMSSKALDVISVPYCFICLLHLANEKGLSLEQAPTLGDFGVAKVTG